MRKRASSESKQSFSFIALLTRKWEISRRIFRDEGVITLFVEVFCQICKPAVWLYDSIRLRWYRAIGMKSVTVLGNQIAVLPKDPGISRELALYKVHEPLATRLLMQTLEPGMNVVDIGSNIGYYAMLEARMVGPAGRVIAIEPMPKNYEQLRRNVQDNGYWQIQTLQLAIGDRDGTAPLYLSGKSNHHSLHRNPSTRGALQVPVRSLDSLLDQYHLSSVDLVRMDLEGYEVIVIHGMLRTIEKYSPRLLVELHPDLLGERVTVEYLRTLQNHRYSAEWVFEQERDMPLRWRFLRIEKPTLNELMRDSRICSGPRAMTALFSRNVRASVPATQVKPGLWQSVTMVTDSRETEARARSGFRRRASNSSD